MSTANLATATQRAELFATIFVLAQLLSRLGDDVLEPMDLTTKQWLLLAVIAKAFPGREPTLSEVAAIYGSSRQNVKQIALQLVARGWVRMVDDPDDRRAVRLQLTRKLQLFESPAHKAREQALFDRIFGDMRKGDLAALHHLLGDWLRSLSTS